MRLPRRLPSMLGLLAACAAALSAEDAPGEPLARVTLASGDRLFTAFQSSVYAAVLNDPAFAEERAQLLAQIGSAQAVIGLDPLDIWRQCGPAVLVMDGMLATTPTAKPILHGTVVAKQLPANLKALLLADGAEASVPGADWAVALHGAPGEAPTIALFGNQLVLGLNGPIARLPPPTQPGPDLVVDLALDRLMAANVGPKPDDQTRQMAAMASLLKGAVHYEATLLPEGIQERISLPKGVGYKAVDRAVLDPLPATTLVEFAVGLDGPGLWRTSHDQLLAAIAAKLSNADHTVTPVEAQTQVDGLLQMVGLPFSLGQLIQGFEGTLVIAIGSGIPVPSVTIALPRTAVTDQLLAMLMAKMRVMAPPEGTSALIPIPNAPVSINLVKGHDHWVLTSDAAVMTGWTTHEKGGWSASPAGRQALEKAPSGAVAIGASDTPALLRLLVGLAGFVPIHDEHQRQQGVAALLKLAQGAKPGYLVASNTEEGLKVEDRGIIAFAGLPLFAAILAQKGQGGRHIVEPGADDAAAQLRDVIMPAEAAFKAKKIIDWSHDGMGAYGLLSELGGARMIIGAQPQHFLPANLSAGSLNGWHYEVFLPDGHGGGMGEPDGQAARAMDAGAAASQERHWVAYAWPDDPSKGTRILALLPDGVVRSAPYTPGDVPEWSDVFGGGNSWEAKAAWEPIEQAPGAPIQK